MKLFNVQKQRSSMMYLLPSVLIILALILFLYGSATLSDSDFEQEYRIVSNALERSITQCYALEGTYPPDLEYLHDNYGFTYNTKHFFINYRYIGGNLRPDVTIITKESEN